ncbi:MAG: GspH/FimT family pseudopilin [Pseudoxanthomonas sp.]
MVAIAVLAIMVAMAVPSFTALINGNRLTGQANELIAALQVARSEAVRRNARVAVCASSDGSNCDTAVEDWPYWLVRLVSTSEVLRVHRVDARVQVLPSARISDNDNQIVFSADGLARDASGALLAAAIGVCMATDSPQQNQRRVGIAAGSRINTTAEDTDASCNVPDDEDE